MAGAPLVAGLEGREAIGWPLRIGERGSVSGGLTIRNRSNQKLDSVEGVGVRGGGPDMIGAYVMSPPPMIGRVFGYRVPARAQALPGAVLGPHEELELVLGVKATAPGRHSFNALAVLYHAGGTSYRTTFPFGLAICSPITDKCLDPLAVSQRS